MERLLARGSQRAASRRLCRPTSANQRTVCPSCCASAGRRSRETNDDSSIIIVIICIDVWPPAPARSQSKHLDERVEDPQKSGLRRLRDPFGRASVPRKHTNQSTALFGPGPTSRWPRYYRLGLPTATGGDCGDTTSDGKHHGGRRLGDGGDGHEVCVPLDGRKSPKSLSGWIVVGLVVFKSVAGPLPQPSP